MSDRPRVLFYFLHLLGHGHLYRAQRLIAAMAQHEMEVDVIYGGERVDIEFDASTVFYLPPIRAASADYTAYLDGDGKPLGQAWLARRQAHLLQHVSGLDSDLVLTEAFPFGRRMVRAEILAMFDELAARPHPPLIVASVRDILQERRKPGRNEEVRDLVQTRYDRVLVHSDPHVIRIDETFPLANDIAGHLAYTGFVVPPAGEQSAAEQTDILVSAGGGSFGAGLIDAALTLAERRTDLSWLISAGRDLPEETYQAFCKRSRPGVRMVRHLDNLQAHMCHASVSISQCGYNTAMDALVAHENSACRAIFVPYDTEGQTEQLRRARELAQRGYAVNLPQSQLTVEGLDEAIAAAMRLARVPHQVDFDGAVNTARLLDRWIAERRAS